MQEANILHIMITNKYEPQKKHRLGTVSKKLLGGGLKPVLRDPNLAHWATCSSLFSSFCSPTKSKDQLADLIL